MSFSICSLDTKYQMLFSASSKVEGVFGRIMSNQGQDVSGCTARSNVANFEWFCPINQAVRQIVPHLKCPLLSDSTKRMLVVVLTVVSPCGLPSGTECLLLVAGPSTPRVFPCSALLSNYMFRHVSKYEMGCWSWSFLITLYPTCPNGDWFGTALV